MSSGRIIRYLLRAERWRLGKMTEGWTYLVNNRKELTKWTEHWTGGIGEFWVSNPRQQAMWEYLSWLLRASGSARHMWHNNLPGLCPVFLAWSSLSSVQFSCSVMSDSLQPHEPQHARPPCPSPTPRVYSNSCPSSRWCHPAISFSVVPCSSCPQSLPASGSFPMSQLFPWGGQSTGVSACASVLPMNTQVLSPSGWTGWISLQPKGLSRVFSSTIVQKHHFFGTQLSLQSNSHIHTWPLEKP